MALFKGVNKYAIFGFFYHVNYLWNYGQWHTLFWAFLVLLCNLVWVIIYDSFAIRSVLTSIELSASLSIHQTKYISYSIIIASDKGCGEVCLDVYRLEFGFKMLVRHPGPWSPWFAITLNIWIVIPDGLWIRNCFRLSIFRMIILGKVES